MLVYLHIPPKRRCAQHTHIHSHSCLYVSTSIERTTEYSHTNQVAHEQGKGTQLIEWFWIMSILLFTNPWTCIICMQSQCCCDIRDYSMLEFTGSRLFKLIVGLWQTYKHLTIVDVSDIKSYNVIVTDVFRGKLCNCTAALTTYVSKLLASNRFTLA